MTTVGDGDALSVLKKKLAEFNAAEQTVPLAAASASKATYIFSGINGKWDPKDHPRDPNTGEFVKALSGFIFGKALTANYSTSSGKKKIDLHPGDVAFKTPAGNVVVSHADGSYTLHHGDKESKIPAGNTSLAAYKVQTGQYQKIGENPGTIVEAESKSEAAEKIAHPDQYGKTASSVVLEPAPKPKSYADEWEDTAESEDASTDGGHKEIPAPPALKPGKTKFTAKQYKQYQEDAKGAFLEIGANGKAIFSGDWVEGLDGKPYLVHASPYGKGKVTAYRWVSTKQQASNLEKEDVFPTTEALAQATFIEDPTGKPYTPLGQEAPSTDAPEKPKHGSLMSQAVAGAIPNTATAHKKHVAAAKGTDLGKKVQGADGKTWFLKSGDWVEIDGKPVQVHSSPNEGNVAIAKWVSTKQQASNNTYDFPYSVLDYAQKIEDPTGKPYVPLDKQEASAAPSVEKAETPPAPESGVPDGWVAEFYVGVNKYVYVKNKGAWAVAEPDSVAGVAANDPDFIEKLEGLAYDPSLADEPSVEVDGAPVGSVVVRNTQKGGFEYEKNKAGKWVLTGGTAPGIAGVLGGEVSDPKAIEEIETVYAVKTGGGAPVGSKATKDWGALGKVIYQKQEDGWTAVGGSEDIGPMLGAKVNIAPVIVELEKQIADKQNIDNLTEPLAEWEKELLGEPYILSFVDEETLSDIPANYVVKVAPHDGSPVMHFLSGEQDDQWLIMKGGSSEPWAEASDSTVSLIINGFDGKTLTVIPEGSAEHSLVMNDPLLHPVTKKASDGLSEYHFQKGVWLDADTGMKVTDAATLESIEEEYEQAQDDLASLNDLVPGDQLHLTNLKTGSKTVYTLKEDGHFTWPTAGGNAQKKAHFAAYLTDKPKIAAKFKWEFVAQDEKQGDAAPKGQQFVHPVSGAVFPLMPGDEVYKHKTTENGYIIVKVDDPNPINFFTQNGKQQKPKAFQKNLQSAYEQVDEWPGKVEVSENGDTVQPDIAPGEVATKAMLDAAAPGDAVYAYSTSHPGILHSYYTKTEAGTWTSSAVGGAPVGEELEHAHVSDAMHGAGATWTYKFYPQGTAPEAGQDEDKSPWGSPDASGTPQVDPEPISTKPVPKGKKKPELPKTYVLPNGNEVSLKPGEAIGLVKGEYGDEFLVHVVAGPKTWQNTNHIYNPDGSPAYWNKAAKWTPTSLKSWAKKHGGEIFAENAVVSDKIDFSTYDATVIPDDAEAYSAVHEYINNARSQFPVNTYSNGTIWGYAGYPQFDDAQWVNLDIQQKLSLVADYENIAGAAVATLEPVAKFDSLEKSDKQDFGKARSGFTLIHRTAVLAREMNDPDTEWDDDKFESELSFIASKVAKPGVSLGGHLKTRFPISDFYSLLSKANTQRKFKNTLSEMSFDPYNGTTEEYDAYAKSKGFPYLAALDSQYQKMWVLNDLGDPSISDYQKKVLENESSKVKSKIVVAELAASLSKSAGSPVIKPKAKGIYEKALLRSEYSWTNSDANSFTLKNVGHDEWKLLGISPDGATTELDVTDAIVTTLLNGVMESGVEVTTSPESAYGADLQISNLKKLETKYGFSFEDVSVSQLKDIVSQEGGAVATSGEPSEDLLLHWLWLHAGGDEVGKFYLEKTQYLSSSFSGSHPHEDSHPGSPSSTAGAAAHKALAAHLTQSPEGVSFLEGHYLPTSTKKKFAAFLGLKGWVEETGFSDNLLAWTATHPAEALKPFVGAYAEQGGGAALKPGNATDEAWLLVNSVDANTDLSALFGSGVGVATMSDDELTSALAKSSQAKSAGLVGPLLGGLPTHMKRLAVWGGTASSVDDEHRLGVLYSVAAKAKAGEFLTEETPAWISPDGTKYPLSPGAKVFKIAGGPYSDEYYVATGPPNANGQLSSAWKFNSTGMTEYPSYHLSDLLSGESGELVFTMPAPVQWDQAKKDVPDLHEAFWKESELVEAGTSQKYKHHEVGAILTASLKNNATLQKDYPNLYAHHKSLPENVRQAVLSALEKDHKPMLAVLEYKASKQHYASMGSKGLFEVGQPWLIHLSKGQTSPSSVSSEWSVSAKQAYAAYFGIPEGGIAEHLNSLLNPAVPTVSKTLPAFADLKLTKTGKTLGGMHTKHVWVDQDGNEWMSKAFDSDPNAKARVDAETGAIRIGRLFGFRSPAANTQAVPGYSYAYLQHLAPSTGDFVSKTPNDLTVKQLQQAMEEHVLDWITSNHDTHPQNLMFDPSGNVFGIDKGQAFKHFPKDKLAVGYLPPENGAAVWYDSFYKALQNGSIDKATADEVTKHVLRRAQQISKDKDAEYRVELEASLQHRTFWPDQYPSREQFIDGLVERKHNLFDDFVDFYKSVYAKSPYEFDIDTENLVPPKLDKDTHIAVSQDYADDVAKSAVHGKAMFFDSKHLEDSHILMSTAKDQNNGTVLTGEAKIRKDGNDVLVEWLQKQTIESHVSVQSQSYNDYDHTPVNTIDPAHLPGNTEWFSALVAGSKTVSSHNASGDKQYNQATLNQMENAHWQINEALSAVLTWKKDNPDIPFKGSIPSKGHLVAVDVELHTMEQQVAWEEALKTYQGYAEKVEAHKGTDQKISPHFTQYAYAPSQSALDIIKAKEATGKPVNPFVPAKIEEILKKAKNGDQITAISPSANGGNPVVYTKQYGGWKSGALTESSEGMAQMVKANGPGSGWTFTYSGSVPGVPDVDTIKSWANSQETNAQISFVKPDGTEVTYYKADSMKWHDGENDWVSGLMLQKHIQDDEWKPLDAKTAEEATSESTTVKVGTKVLKVVKKSNTMQNGHFDFDSGEQKLTGGETSSFSGFSLSGHMYEIDFGSTVIEYRPWAHDVPLSQKGLLRFRKKDWTGDSDSIEEIFDVLRQMGLSLDPADEASMELFYWEHLYGILRDRKDGKNGKWATLHGKIVDGLKPNMTTEEKLVVFKEAWSEALGSEVVETADWMPKFSRQSLQAQEPDGEPFTSGHPYWHRPDFTLKDIKGWMGNNVTATSLTYGGNASDALPIALSGSMLSSEERARYYGSLAKAGASSASDMSKGSSAMVYTKPKTSASSGSYEVVYHPKVLLRTTNYAFGYDAFGDITAKKDNAYWDGQAMHTQTTVELMIKNSVSVMDDIIMLKFPTQALRDKAVKAYKDRGITKLHGLPIEDIFVVNGTATKALNHVYKEALNA